MYKIDKIDRGIMYELDRDARQSYSEIANRIKSRKDIVAYRFNQLLKNKVIKKFVTIFSLGKISIFNYKIYFQFHGLSKEEEDKMLNDFIGSPDVIWVAKCEGRWDLMISHYAGNIIEFAQIKNNIFEKYGRYVQDYSIIINEEAFIFNRDYLVTNNKMQRKFHLYIGEVKNFKLSEEDKKLAHLISNNARYSLTELANILKLDFKTIKNRIRNFEKIGFISGYTTFYNLNEIGLKFFKLFIYTQEISKVDHNSLLEYCKNQPNVIHLIKTIGSWELELEIESEDPDYIHTLSKELRNKFPNIIKKIESAVISNEIKLDFFPQDY